MFSGEDSHFTRHDLQEVSQQLEVTTGLLLHTIPRSVARQKHLTNKIRNILQKIMNAMGKRMERQITRDTQSILKSFKDADRTNMVPTGLWRSFPSTS